MSLEQILREYPSLKILSEGPLSPERWPDAQTEARVSRVSLDTLCMPIQEIKDGRRTTEYYLDVYYEECTEELHGSRWDKDTIGSMLCKVVDKESKVRFVVFKAITREVRFRRASEQDKAHPVEKEIYRSVVVYKMPKRISLRKLLQQYREQLRKQR